MVLSVRICEYTLRSDDITTDKRIPFTDTAANSADR